MKEIEHQLDMGLCNLYPESKRLLEIDTPELLSSTIESQQYWLYAIEAATTVGELSMKLASRKATSWNEIMSNEKFNYLSTQSPQDETTTKTRTTTNPPERPGKRPNPPIQSS